MHSNVRVNGFQRPFSRDQLTSWLLYPLLISVSLYRYQNEHKWLLFIVDAISMYQSFIALVWALLKPAKVR